MIMDYTPELVLAIRSTCRVMKLHVDRYAFRPDSIPLVEELEKVNRLGYTPQLLSITIDIPINKVKLFELRCILQQSPQGFIARIKGYTKHQSYIPYKSSRQYATQMPMGDLEFMRYLGACIGHQITKANISCCGDTTILNMVVSELLGGIKFGNLNFSTDNLSIGASYKMECLSLSLRHTPEPAIIAITLLPLKKSGVVSTLKNVLATLIHSQLRFTPIADSSLSANATTSSALFDVDEELAKIAASCLSTRNYEQLSGNIVKDLVAIVLDSNLVKESTDTIGLVELRSVLHRPWQPRNRTKPNEAELASGPTIEAYYDLREPSSKMRSLDSHQLLEQNVTSGIDYLDKRFPSIRTIFRRKFEEIRRSDLRVVDKKVIDRMIAEFSAIRRRVRDAISQTQERNSECWDRVD